MYKRINPVLLFKEIVSIKNDLNFIEMHKKLIFCICLMFNQFMFSQNDIEFYHTLYNNVFLATLLINDSETGQLLEKIPSQTVEFISGANGIVVSVKSVTGIETFHFVEGYYDLVDNKLIFTSDNIPIIKGREFSLDPASTSQNLLWTTQATIKEKSIQITYQLESHLEYVSGGSNEVDLVGLWKLSSLKQGDRTENIDTAADNVLLKINDDKSFAGFDTSGYYILSGSGHFLLLDNQKNTSEIAVMQIAMPNENILEVTKADDYQKTIMKFIRVK